MREKRRKMTAESAKQLVETADHLLAKLSFSRI